MGAPTGTLVIGGSTAANAAKVSPAGSNVGSHLFAARNLFNYSDDVIFTRGIHQISVGVWFQQIQANDLPAQGQYGQATFSSLNTFLRGITSNFAAVPSPTPMAWRSFEGAWYIQDSLRLRANLQLTLGFRSEFTNGWNEATGKASNYLFGADGVIETQPRVGLSVFTVNNAKFLPEPRVGLAWDIFGHSKTVIHAGFGLHNDLQDDLSYRLDQNAPFNTTLTLKNVPVASPSFVRGAPLPAGGKIGPGGVQPNLFTPTVVSYTFKIEQQIDGNTVLNVGYVGLADTTKSSALTPTCPFQPFARRRHARRRFPPERSFIRAARRSRTPSWPTPPVGFPRGTATTTRSKWTFITASATGCN